MEIHKDFILYGSGVYEKTYQVTGQTVGHHSVKIIGWGSENEVNYWVRKSSIEAHCDMLLYCFD